MGKGKEGKGKRESLQYAVSKRKHPAEPCESSPYTLINGLTCNDHKQRTKYTEYMYECTSNYRQVLHLTFVPPPG